MAEMIDDKLFFKAIDLLKFGQRHDASVAHENINGRIEGGDLIATRHDRTELGQLTNQWCRTALDTITSGLCLFHSSGGANDVGALRGHDTHGLVAEPGITARNHDRLARQVDPLNDIIGRGCKAVVAARYVCNIRPEFRWQQ